MKKSSNNLFLYFILILSTKFIVFIHKRINVPIAAGSLLWGSINFMEKYGQMNALRRIRLRHQDSSFISILLFWFCPSLENHQPWNYSLEKISEHWKGRKGSTVTAVWVFFLTDNEWRWSQMNFFMVWHDYEWGNNSFDKITIMRKPMNKKKWENHKTRILNFCIFLLFSFFVFSLLWLYFLCCRGRHWSQGSSRGRQISEVIVTNWDLLASPHSRSCWLWLIWTGTSWAWSRARCFRVSGQTEWRPTWKYVSSINYEVLRKVWISSSHSPGGRKGSIPGARAIPCLLYSISSLKLCPDYPHSLGVRSPLVSFLWLSSVHPLSGVRGITKTHPLSGHHL